MKHIKLFENWHGDGSELENFTEREIMMLKSEGFRIIHCYPQQDGKAVLEPDMRSPQEPSYFITKYKDGQFETSAPYDRSFKPINADNIESAIENIINRISTK